MLIDFLDAPLPAGIMVVQSNCDYTFRSFWLRPESMLIQRWWRWLVRVDIQKTPLPSLYRTLVVPRAVQTQVRFSYHGERHGKMHAFKCGVFRVILRSNDAERLQFSSRAVLRSVRRTREPLFNGAAPLGLRLIVYK